MGIERSISPSNVVMAYDATKQCTELELNLAIKTVRTKDGILRRGDKLVVLGVLHLVPHPLGYQAKASPGLFQISTHAVIEEASKKADMFVENLQTSAEMCEDDGVSIEVKIIAGSPMKQVILQEAMACNAAWVILDRRLKRDIRFYIDKIPCRIAYIRDMLSVEVLKHFSKNTTGRDVIQTKFIYSICKPVPKLNSQSSDDEKSSLFSCESSPFSIDSLEFSDRLNSSLMPSSSNDAMHLSNKESVDASTSNPSSRDDGEITNFLRPCSLASLLMQASMDKS
ncbi:uncharacterized protein LOC107423453 isoform X1 [Ziziphus jujuba]|uniref:Uncharacterized protein LOC107423453 isoform X1 n=2 Tax=Ziziphus jujuba TaxID=326968 RepID=A0A6P4AIT7_ZIZJJ|nr:uncharacterized protein LOC107423453 isoform X1 [Ziziphus jujuba]KAH7519713.1 hypothetical protein FEM48_Zijuj08G0066500 [Ziziphus jujuba var. spinosa]